MATSLIWECGNCTGSNRWEAATPSGFEWEVQQILWRVFWHGSTVATRLTIVSPRTLELTFHFFFFFFSFFCIGEELNCKNRYLPYYQKYHLFIFLDMVWFKKKKKLSFFSFLTLIYCDSGKWQETWQTQGNDMTLVLSTIHLDKKIAAVLPSPCAFI